MMMLLTSIILATAVLIVPREVLHGIISSSHRYTNLSEYNNTYPLTPPLLTENGITYHIGAVTDLDTDSLYERNTWISYLKLGLLTISYDMKSVHIEWQKDVVIKSHLSQSGRGMELSELVVFNGKLYTCDDRTGIIYEITRDFHVLPFVILNDGDGLQTKGFKCEWMTVKDGILWVGGLGKEWTTTVGLVQNLHPQWVKSIGHIGDVRHHDWITNYNELRKKAGFQAPGYIIHESAAWSAVHQRWFFLPRRASREIYTEVDDEHRATNILFSASHNFSDISFRSAGTLHHTRGFSSFKFVPDFQDQLIVALKSEEDGGNIASYITVLTVDGEVVLDETYMGSHKFEGIEFL